MGTKAGKRKTGDRKGRRPAGAAGLRAGARAPKPWAMHFPSFDGTMIAWQEMGSGRPLLLIHGLFSTGTVNWVKFGTAGRLAAAGWRVILPDLRGHGESEAPADPARWPEDVLAQDAEALIAHLGLGADLVVGGYSIGARTTARLLARGLQPAAAIFAGMGLDGLTAASRRSDWFIRLIDGRGTWKRGDPYFLAEAFMNANVRDPEPLLHLLRRQPDTSEETIAGFDLPVLVVCGDADDDTGSAHDLAALMPRARFAEIPGTHMSSVTRPELAAAMLEFLKSL
jgi:pimeloyl-ACP methyl ester carboxylesterase